VREDRYGELLARRLGDRNQDTRNFPMPWSPSR